MKFIFSNLLYVSSYQLLIVSTLLFFSCKTPQLSNYVKISPRESSTLYFITPTTFNSRATKATFTPDFTIDYHIDSPSTAIMKFFLNAKEPITQIDSLSWNISHSSTDTSLFTIHTFEKMFVEKGNKNIWQNRYSCKFPLAILQKLLSYPQAVQATIYVAQQSYTFTSTKDWQKLHHASFETLQLQWSQDS